MIILLCMGQANGASEVWIEGSGSGQTKQDAFYSACLNAIWKVLYKEIGEGADVDENLEARVADQVKTEMNSFVANRRVKTLKEDEFVGGFQLTADFLIKQARVAKLAKDVMKDAATTQAGKKGGAQPTIMFMVENDQLRAAFSQEFNKKGLTIISKEKAIQDFEKALSRKKEIEEEWNTLLPNEQEERRIMAILTESGGEDIPDNKAVTLAQFLKADYFVKGKYRYEDLGKDNLGNQRSMLNLEELKIYESASGKILSIISDIIYASGATSSEARQVATKKSAVVLANQSFEQIIDSWKTRN
ncbi:MAG: hypothetical protein EOM25_06920 [Deltaproteobacteria bacterium]|nr:hypothetical protein [Deltaproteobacteria bacterium]